MASRSVSELLPRPFDELDVDDVRELLRRVGEERESLFFERKSELRRDLLGKSCAAFANTMGGLLVVGVGDEDDEIRGVEPASGEPQVWVKDVLRGSVVPLPPFRARHIEVSDGRVLLLVLVEESSTTPHLLVRQGAIYVRNPGSSDPLPIGDQRRLNDLQQRGIESREGAVQRAREAAARRPPVSRFDYPARRPVSLALAATGVADWFEGRLLGTLSGVDRLRAALPVPQGRSAEDVVWKQHALHVERIYASGAFRPPRAEVVHATGAGLVSLQGGFVGDVQEDDEHLTSREVLAVWIQRSFAAGRALLLELGAHGDLRLVVRVFAPRRIEWRGGQYPELQTTSSSSFGQASTLMSQASAKPYDE